MELSSHTSTAVSGSSAELMDSELPQWSVIDRLTGFSVFRLYGR